MLQSVGRIIVAEGLQAAPLRTVQLEQLAAGHLVIRIEADGVEFSLLAAGKVKFQYRVGRQGVRQPHLLPGIAGHPQGGTAIFDRQGRGDLILRTKAFHLEGLCTAFTSTSSRFS